mgnify:CR=1 FL=1|tara:strand:+ start:85 stop:612 length:528 start_codon:yes stop_codon:yes gene_type:complete
MEKKLLIIEDDKPFRDRLARSMEKKGFKVESVGEVKSAKKLIKFNNFSHAIVDMKLDKDSGLEMIKFIKNESPDTRSLLLTGYGNIATTVAAIKSGAVDYLPKPAEIDQIYNALIETKYTLPLPPENVMTADRIRWEHIQRVFIQCNRNVSETARKLRMHRRTLQRILNKHAPKE